MTINEIKRWAKQHGYKIDRTKVENQENSYTYTWFKIDDPSINGTTVSLSKVATAVFNSITNNAHVEYQEQYRQEQLKKDISHENQMWG